jgi:hypothetical protein
LPSRNTGKSSAEFVHQVALPAECKVVDLTKWTHEKQGLGAQFAARADARR